MTGTDDVTTHEIKKEFWHKIKRYEDKLEDFKKALWDTSKQYKTCLKDYNKILDVFED